MTQEELQAIKERVGKATDGGWRHDYHHVHDDEGDCICETFTAGGESNAEFIAHARTDVPRLIAEVEALRELLRQCYDIGERDIVRLIDGSGLVE